MAMGKHMEKEQLERYLLYIIGLNEKKFGIENDAVDPNVRLANLIMNVYRRTGKKVVVLIDEYDAPLLDVAHEDDNLKDLRNIMRNFYSPLKDCDPYLRFVFLTGITKFSQLSIFSELNNITNISMNREYSGICGITKEELLTQMSDDIDELAKSLGSTRETAIEELKMNYDGYHFSAQSSDIFNPFSLLNCFANQDFGSYWFASGTPTYLINMMRKFHVLPATLGKMYAKSSAFDAPTENMTAITPLLYQSGYLTIKDYDKTSKLYTLDLPNKEIKVGLFESLLPNYLEGMFAQNGDVTIAQMSVLIRQDDMDGALQLLQTFSGNCAILQCHQPRRSLPADAVYHLLALDWLCGRCRSAHSQWTGRYSDADHQPSLYHRAEAEQGCPDGFAANQPQELCPALCALRETYSESRYQL